MTFRAKYFLFGGVAIVAAVGVIGWRFFGGQGGEPLKPDGGPVVTVMDFGQPFPSIRSPLAGDIENSGRVRR